MPTPKKSLSSISTESAARTHISIRSDGNKSMQNFTSEISTAEKPSNVFYTWYKELCRRQNVQIYSGLKHNRVQNGRVLEIQADRVKLEEWYPIITALRTDNSLHVIAIRSKVTSHPLNEEADSEEKVRQIRKWLGTISTKYILKALLGAIENCLLNTSVLSTLELEGLQIKKEYLSGLLTALFKNKTIRFLSFKRSPIGDGGCGMLCEALRVAANIEVINLTGCRLGRESADHIAKLIKFQQINRYCESWHNSLRYNNPDVNEMAGLRRITLNDNPRIGDEGLELIIKELDDDLWLKALDMQRCNITERMGKKLLDVINYNRSLQVADFRNNDLTAATIAKVIELLRYKNRNVHGTEYEWCASTTSLEPSTNDTRKSNATITNKTNARTQNNSDKSFKRVSINTKPVIHENRATVLQRMNRERNANRPEVADLIKARKEYIEKESYTQRLLKAETARRIKAEEKNEELQKQIDELLAEQSNHLIMKELTNLKNYINKFIEIANRSENEEFAPIVHDMQKTLAEIKAVKRSIVSPRSDSSISFNNLPLEGKHSKSNEIRMLYEHMLEEEAKNAEEKQRRRKLKNKTNENESDSENSSDAESIIGLKKLVVKLEKSDSGESRAEEFSLTLIDTDTRIPLKQFLEA